MSEGSEQLVRLREIMRTMGRVAVAYSGGTDSTLVLKVGREELGDSCVAITASGDLLPPYEVEEALSTARGLGVEPVVVRAEVLTLQEFSRNAPDRCYTCKRKIFRSIIDAARGLGVNTVADGSHAGDLDADRPGRRALRELGVRSPLTEAGMDKEDVRRCSRLLGLPTAERPASPCLATRVPFGDEITAEKLRQVAEAERAVRALGVRVVRVRHHGAIARIEVPAADIPTVLSAREPLVRAFKELGFIYVDVDLQGYRSGSMAEALGKAR